MPRSPAHSRRLPPRVHLEADTAHARVCWGLARLAAAQAMLAPAGYMFEAAAVPVLKSSEPRVTASPVPALTSCCDRSSQLPPSSARPTCAAVQRSATCAERARWVRVGSALEPL